MRFTPTFLVLSLFSGLLRAEVPVSETGLSLPPGFVAEVFADDLMKGRQRDALRFLAAGAEGVVYAKTSRGGLLALRDKDGDGRADERHEIGSGGGTGIALRDGWLYSSSNSSVVRHRIPSGSWLPEEAFETIVKDLPDENSHSAKSFAFDAEGRLLVEVGSPYNVYSEPDRQKGAKGRDATEFLRTYGGFWRFDATRPNQTQAEGFHFSTGHRHVLAVALQPVSKDFYVVMMGRDNLNTVAPEHYDNLDNAERVAEEMHRLVEGANLGWPYTYYDPIRKARMLAPEFGGDNHKRAEPGKYPDPVVAFPAHWAPLQMLFYTGSQFPSRYKGGAFVAFHGSWNRAPLPQEGYNLSFAPFDEQGRPTGSYEVFAANLAGGTRFRIGGVTQAPDGSLYLSDTVRGRIWRIRYTGTSASAVSVPGQGAAPNAVSESPAASLTKPHPGQSLYLQYCAVCHMEAGTGAGRLNPALKGSAIVAGDPEVLVKALLKGTAGLPAKRPRSSNKMPGFSMLDDEQAAQILSYIRAEFGGGAPAITPQQIAAQR